MTDIEENLLPQKSLYTYDELEDWYKDNEYITDGYRPSGKNSKYYLKSILKMHNETINIWTHFLGSLLFFSIILYSNISGLITRPFGDVVSLNIFLSAVAICFFASGIMHTFHPMSEKTYKQLCKIDYIGIAITILGTYGPFIYFAFYCQENIQWVYYILVNILGLITIVISSLDEFQKSNYRIYRGGIFALLVVSAICPIIHRIVLNPQNQEDFTIEMEYYILSIFFYALGLFFYASQIPEKYWKGRFNIILSSHQIFHFFTIIASFVTFYGIIKTHKAALNITC